MAPPFGAGVTAPFLCPPIAPYNAEEQIIMSSYQNTNLSAVYFYAYFPRCYMILVFH